MPLIIDLFKIIYEYIYIYYIYYYSHLILFFLKEQAVSLSRSGFFSLSSFCKLHFTIYTFYLHISIKSSIFAHRIENKYTSFNLNT